MSAAPLAPICSICTWQGLVACDDLSSCYLQYSGRAITNTDAQTQIQMMGAWANWKLLGAFSFEDLHLPLWSFKSLAHFASFKLSKLLSLSNNFWSLEVE